MLAQLLALSIVAAPSTPLAVVKNGNDQVQKLIAAADATAEQLASRADDFVDFAELARRSLGREWAKLNKKQQEDFSQTMKSLLRASYAQKALIDGKGKATTEYGAEQITGNEASVGTTLLVAGDKFPVDYRLYRTDEKSPWKIYDVVTDTVSLVEAYRDQFQVLIAKKGFEGLLSTLKARRDKLEKKDAVVTK